MNKLRSFAPAQHNHCPRKTNECRDTTTDTAIDVAILAILDNLMAVPVGPMREALEVAVAGIEKEKQEGNGTGAGTVEGITEPNGPGTTTNVTMRTVDAKIAASRTGKS